MALQFVYQKLKIMKSFLLYIWAVLLLGTFTAIVTGMGEAPFLGYVLSYCFWGCMFMPMLGAEDEKVYTGNEKRRKETTGSN